MTKIPPFKPHQPLIDMIMECKPVQNLTEEEVKETLRLEELYDLLKDDNRSEHFAVTVWQDDQRLEDCSDEDKFKAMLLDTDCRKTILTSKRCIYCFGGSTYRWRKIARNSVLTTTKSVTVEAEYGGRYLGTGWVIAPNIVTLRKFIKEIKIKDHGKAVENI